ncbi:class E sortase [Streptomyces sp. Je 1-4]|uniref:class E sortase n=1 Tax=Streptomyces TaxID=1883 RepID=UPI0021D9AC40|nr:MULTISPECIES: class E sortase [unclassified Streptomyces]UYB41325.1 class E sortase [Streptomyces sp. Je 1-4]UZQ37511.1 class E sortase [Streptomyces sp. Je 1-4] [Streptomyces sp. Je 1-4 4N24]UZQ44928.1 class E sortase [Streptomyces sp. Je 1-4] [Streptomyces sp. Je 1-4 4N24_ara]
MTLRGRTTVRCIVRTLSEICVTVGALIVLFVAYVLFWTGVRADSAMDGEIGRLQHQWATGPVTAPDSTPAPDGDSAPAEWPRRYTPGASFAVMYIPRLGSDWTKPVLEGTATDVLKRGLGHYARTARLGETGNFSVAGHRRTYGDPFKDFPRLRPGDAVVLTDGTTWFTYRIDNRPYTTLPGDIGVIDPVPRKSGFNGPGRYLTLTTCEPEWGHSHRLIAWAHLDSTQPVAQGRPSALTG